MTVYLASIAVATLGLLAVGSCDPLPGHDDRVMTCEIAAGFAMDQDCR